MPRPSPPPQKGADYTNVRCPGQPEPDNDSVGQRVVSFPPSVAEAQTDASLLGDLHVKRWLPLLLSLAGVVALAAPDRFQIVRDGVRLNASPGPAFESDVVGLLQSCSVESTKYAVNSGTLKELLASKWLVRVNLVTPRSIKTSAGVIWASEILVVLRPEALPGHVYTALAGELRSFTKYRPDALLAVGSEPMLKLTGARPYKELARSR